MGFIKKIAKGIGKIAKGVIKFAKSPIGKLLINVGLTALTGGAGGILAKGLGMLGKMGGIGKMIGSFSGFASKFMGPVQNLMSRAGLGGLGGFLNNAGGTSDLLKMAGNILSARQQAPQADAATEQIGTHNLSQIFAWRHAQMLQASLTQQAA